MSGDPNLVAGVCSGLPLGIQDLMWGTDNERVRNKSDRRILKSTARILCDMCPIQAECLAQSIIGQDALIDQMILGLLANGHLLLESLPGLAKTRAVKSLARNLAAKMSRVQFTPDLLPSDITGSEVLHQEGGKNLFRFEPGPLFGNIILADEISPDGCRLWDSVTGEKLDKDRFRRDLGGEVEAYQEVARRLGLLQDEAGEPTVLDLDTHRKKRDGEKA